MLFSRHIALNAVICMIKNIFSLIMESWLLRDVGFYRSFIPFYVLRNLFNTKMSFICYSPAGRCVLGETVPEVLSTAWSRRPRAVLRPRAQFLPMRTDLSRWKTFLFFSYSNLKVSGKFFFSLQPVCVKRTIDCKAKQNITTWFLVR